MNYHTVCTKHNSSSLAYNKITSCNIPRMYTNLPESICPSTGDSTHVDCGTALCTYSEHTTACSLQLNNAIWQTLGKKHEPSYATWYNFQTSLVDLDSFIEYCNHQSSWIYKHKSIELHNLHKLTQEQTKFMKTSKLLLSVHKKRWKPFYNWTRNAKLNKFITILWSRQSHAFEKSTKRTPADKDWSRAWYHIPHSKYVTDKPHWCRSKKLNGKDY